MMFGGVPKSSSPENVTSNALPNYGLQLHECNARGSLQGGPEKRDQMHLPNYGVASPVECIGVFF